MAFDSISPASGRRFDQDRVEVSYSCFTGSSGTEEYNIMLKPIRDGRFEQQLSWLESAAEDTLARNGLEKQNVVFRRFFCRDLPPQIDHLSQQLSSGSGWAANGAVSVVIQPPTAAAQVSLWVYCIRDPNVEIRGTGTGASFTLLRGDLEHVWTTGLVFPDESGSRAQTSAIFRGYETLLERRAMTLRDNCLRTWLYVRDVDTNYRGLVAGRKEVFEQRRLTAQTHYIASTGIQASFADNNTLVAMDAYAVKGLHAGQVRYLQALGHLSPTDVYGVAFERATSVAYRDRKHIIVSGTASIDSEGEVVHTGDVVRQLGRALENIEALLAQSGATIQDMQYLIAYLRNPGDARAVDEALRQRVGEKPLLIVAGAVCRPGWLVEVEGSAIVSHRDESLPPF